MRAAQLRVAVVTRQLLGLKLPSCILRLLSPTDLIEQLGVDTCTPFTLSRLPQLLLLLCSRPRGLLRRRPATALARPLFRTSLLGLLLILTVIAILVLGMMRHSSSLLGFGDDTIISIIVVEGVASLH